jgi:carboxyl-terminal processing protease
MIDRLLFKLLPLLLSGFFIVPFTQANLFARAITQAKSASEETTAIEKTNVTRVPVTAGPFDGRIGWVTASLLEQSHYSHQRLNEALSGKFYDRYLDSLDPQHLHFLQSDLGQFDRYRTNLGNLTLSQNVRPGMEIFNRFMERLEQRVAYVDQLLDTEEFSFDKDERITINRKEQPFPKNIDEAKQLWRERLRFEYLQEKLAKIDAKKAAAKSTAKTDDKKTGVKKLTEHDEIVETLKHTYHRSLRNFIDWNHEDVLQVYLDALAHVYDPHSDYMGPEHLDSFAISMNLSLSGIGAELLSEDGYCTIRRLLPGGPAEKSKKIKEKDRIIAVAQADKPPVDVVDMNLTKVVQMIRGTKGTEVRLTIIPSGGARSDSKVISLVRDEIKLEDQAAKSKIIEMANANGSKTRLGVIDLPSFYAPFDFGGGRRPDSHSDEAAGGKSTTADVARLLKKLKAENVSGVVLDLRRNGGGSLEEAVNLTGLFIKSGPVVQIRDFQNNIQRMEDGDSSVAYDGPLIVLTSRFSASASEILAGALQDYGRAIVVGDASTHGKGTVQSVTQLRPFMQVPDRYLTNDPGALKLTIKKFYRASGASTQLKGVVPDIILPSVVSESKDFGEAALDNPLPWDTIPSAKYDHLNLVDPYVSDLREMSERRRATDKEFQYIRQDIDLYRKIQADKTISLNEKDRIKEKDEAEARQKARDKERLARAQSTDKIYEISLRQADMPGLPAPVAKTNNVASVNNSSTEAPTNSTALAKSTGDPDVQDDAEDEKPPAIDVSLDEAERILVDYLRLLHKPPLLTVEHQASVSH